jgi:hypothetical protein
MILGTYHKGIGVPLAGTRGGLGFFLGYGISLYLTSGTEIFKRVIDV